MDYTLAKELKDAGFPLRRHPNQERQPQEGEYVVDHVLYLVPTLSELIEACGEELDMIRHWATKWGAYGPTTRGMGATPEEAVARLWLALTSKGKG